MTRSWPRPKAASRSQSKAGDPQARRRARSRSTCNSVTCLHAQPTSDSHIRNATRPVQHRPQSGSRGRLPVCRRLRQRPQSFAAGDANDHKRRSAVSERDRPPDDQAPAPVLGGRIAPFAATPSLSWLRQPRHSASSARPCRAAASAPSVPGQASAGSRARMGPPRAPTQSARACNGPD
jgi:hypothetical protein